MTVAPAHEIEFAVTIAAQAAHEANRVWCLSMGDNSQVPWEDAAQWQRDSAVTGVKAVLAGSGSRDLHESWMAEKLATGWKYGPKKDPETKEHPCLVAYDELPPAQKSKDAIFLAVVKVFLAEAGLMKDG